MRAQALRRHKPCGAGSSTRPGRVRDPPPRGHSSFRRIGSDAEKSPDDLDSVQQRVAAMPPIVLGKDIAEDLGATLNSVVLVTSPQGELTPFGLVPKYSRFRVVGIFNSGFFDYDSSWAFTRLSDTQNLDGLGDQIYGARVQGRRHLPGRTNLRRSSNRLPAKAS